MSKWHEGALPIIGYNVIKRALLDVNLCNETSIESAEWLLTDMAMAWAYVSGIPDGALGEMTFTAVLRNALDFTGIIDKLDRCAEDGVDNANQNSFVRAYGQWLGGMIGT